MNKILEPILIILGATGSGKSKLAIEIAKKFTGEIINADSMQIYKGLDIVTNKVSIKEREMCPHHLLDYVNPLEYNFHVSKYKESAISIIADIHKKGKLPIIVGGTNYYIESLLWDFILENLSKSTSSDSDSDSVYDDSNLLYQQLLLVDPETAKQTHPNDIRKIKRALEIYNLTGKTKSYLLKDQHKDLISKEVISGPLIYANSFMLWIKCQQEVLDNRINQRVDEMMKLGLIEELLDFHKQYNFGRLDKGKVADYSHGIFQSIGFKEFHDYLILDEEKKNTPEAIKLLEKGIFDMKLATRRYSRRQIKWIRNRFLKRKGVCVPLIYTVDSTNPERWLEDVLFPASQIVESFIKCEEITFKPLPKEEYNNPNVNEKCNDCNKYFVKQSNFNAHMLSKKHKKMVERNRKLSKLVATKDFAESTNLLNNNFVKESHSTS